MLLKDNIQRITFNIIVFNQQKEKKAGAGLVVTITSDISGLCSNKDEQLPIFTIYLLMYEVFINSNYRQR